MPLVAAENLVKRYDKLTAVDDVSFTIDKGQIFGFLGPNGAGKSTTISMLSTYLEPTSGDAVIDGLSVSREARKVKGIIGDRSPGHRPLPDADRHPEPPILRQDVRHQRRASWMPAAGSCWIWSSSGTGATAASTSSPAA